MFLLGSNILVERLKRRLDVSHAIRRARLTLSLRWDRVVTMKRMLARAVVMHASKEVADFTDEGWDYNKE
jgi:hypothetical protein